MFYDRSNIKINTIDQCVPFDKNCSSGICSALVIDNKIIQKRMCLLYHFSVKCNVD